MKFIFTLAHIPKFNKPNIDNGNFWGVFRRARYSKMSYQCKHMCFISYYMRVVVRSSRWRKFKSVQIKGPALFQGEITKQQKFINKIFKNYSRTTRPSSAKLSIKHPWLNEIQVCSNERSLLLPMGDYNEITKIHW